MIEKLVLKPIIVSIDFMDKFKQTEIKKIKPIKNIWYDWLINQIPDPVIKSTRGFKHKAISFFLGQIHLNKHCMEKERN